MIDRTGSNIRFASNNFLEQGIFSYSSQLSASFPASNLYHESRSKVARFGGHFEITAANNKLYIADGTNKTVTLTAGNYTYATLAAHIQTQLNASSSLWTCAYDSVSTFKFTIARSSGTATLRQTQTTAAVWDTLGFTAGVDTTALTQVADVQRNHTSEWVQVELGVPQLATFAAVLGGIDSIFPLSPTATVTLQANNVDSWTAPPYSLSLPIGNLSAMAFDETNTDEYTHFRLSIVDPLNTGGPSGFELANIYIGDYLTISRNVAPGFSKSLIDPTIVQQSETGALYFDLMPRYLSISNNTIELLSGDDQRAIEQLFYDLGVRKPFYVSIDPLLNITASLEELTKYMIMVDPPTFDCVFRNYYNIGFNMREAF